MNIRQKNFICNGVVWGLIFFILCFIISYYSFNGKLKDSLFISISTGIITGIINGLIQSRFTKSYKRLSALTFSPQHFERLKIETPANHIIDDHLISGKLFLTQNRLIFISFENKENYWILEDFKSF